MKALSLALAALLCYSPVASACTTFLLGKSARNIVAKSFEWDLSMGMAVHNKRNVKKEAILLTGSGPLKWTSRYSSLTFTQYGREFPLSGMNEKGLVVEIMVLSSSAYPASGPEGATNESQWIQFILDTSANIGEAVANARKVRVAKLMVPVHYLACDASGACASFEYIGGKMVIHSGANLPVPVLTNSTYSDSLSHLRGFQGFGGKRAIPTDQGSLSRFVRAAHVAAQYSPAQDPVSYSFAALDKFSSRHQWSLVWEPLAQRVHYRTRNSAETKTIDIKAFSGSCRSAVKMIDMEERGLRGNVTASLRDYSTEYAREILTRNPPLRQLLPVALEYPGAMTSCQE